VRKRRLCGLLTMATVLALPIRSDAEFPPELGNVDGRVVMVDFWASWCVPCRRSFPWMNDMLSRYESDGLQIIGVNLDKERALAASFLTETPADFDLHYDPEGALAARFGVQAMPSSFLLDAQGNVIATHYGFRFSDAEEYEAAIVDALAAADRAQ
jgi:thiol-disulfide isomerase/thioredoxin